MYVGIIGGDATNPQHLQLVDDCLENLIESSGYYLFTFFRKRIKLSMHCLVCVCV